mmetsp:Transcript_15951/g.19473  ORF Transcript_15951/g.19473 Transcript_15951/m.19473 type:complete len:190 (+) Transcript_15951:311-880(+)
MTRMIVSTLARYTYIISLVHIMILHGFRRCYMVKAWTVSNHNFQNKYNIGHSFVSSKLVPMSKRYNSVQENCVFTPLMIQTKYSSGNTKRTCLHLSSNTLKTNNSVSEGYYDSMNYDEEENKENERVDNNAAAADDDDDDDDENDSSSNPIINEFSQRLQTSLKKATDSMMKKENSLSMKEDCIYYQIV